MLNLRFSGQNWVEPLQEPYSPTLPIAPLSLLLSGNLECLLAYIGKYLFSYFCTREKNYSNFFRDIKKNRKDTRGRLSCEIKWISIRKKSRMPCHFERFNSMKRGARSPVNSRGNTVSARGAYLVAWTFTWT